MLADPLTPLARRENEVATLISRARRAVRNRLDAERSALDATNARLTTLGPAATLARGYAVVQRVDPAGNSGVLRSIEDAPLGARLRVRVMDGAVHAVVRSGEEHDLPASGGSRGETRA